MKQGAWKWLSLCFVCCISFCFSNVAAQDVPVITADNITHLRSARQIDFAALPAESGTITAGWFALDGAGQRIALINREQAVLVINNEGQLLDHFNVMGVDGRPATFLDAAFSLDGTLLAAVFTDSQSFWVAYRWVDAHFMQYYQFPSVDVPLRVWVDDALSVWLEIAPQAANQARYIRHLTPLPLNRLREGDILTSDEYHDIPSAPETDPDAFVRIGRITPPLAVTVSQSGLLKVWQMQTGAVLHSIQLDELPGMGQVNADGDQLAWRDGESQWLSVLSLISGDNQHIAHLGGQYWSHLLFNKHSDVIIQIDAENHLGVVAWQVGVGEPLPLGNFRSCGRPLDFAALSRDSRVMVLGCDSGLDIWQVLGG